MREKYFMYSAITVLGLSVLSLCHYKQTAIPDKGPIVTIDSAMMKENAPPCLQMYYAIMKHADTYDIPLNYAYGIAFVETSYQGPCDWDYTNKRKSCVGAIGPMQIMLATGKSVWPDRKVTANMLMSNIDFNVETSMKLLRILHDKYKDWKLVFGCYNTGKPCKNKYAEKVFNYIPKFN